MGDLGEGGSHIQKNLQDLRKVGSEHFNRWGGREGWSAVISQKKASRKIGVLRNCLPPTGPTCKNLTKNGPTQKRTSL